MPEIRQIYIRNFRSIKEMYWYPKPGLNCLIGPGDSGKSTILDAIDLTLGVRRSYPFSDADFYQMNTNLPIEIYVTLGALPDQLKNIELYGLYLRSFNAETYAIADEPQRDQEMVLTIKLTVDEDLEPDWQLYSERAFAEGTERRLLWKHRELVAPVRLGTNAQNHLAWGRNSVLNKLSEESLDVSGTLASIGRQTRQSFANNQFDDVDEVLEQVKQIADNLGVPVGNLKALLDVKGVSLTYGAISLHNEDDTPLRQLGTGSTRLLISGLQKAVSTSKMIIVDEAEYGLEPYRITRLLNELGSKAPQPSKQVFITTHSPHVLRELQAEQLHVVRQIQNQSTQTAPQYSHFIYSMSGTDEEQSTLRACSEAFLSRIVVVAEGKTEIGLIRGIDLYVQDQNNQSIQSKGVHCADGGGDSMFARAHTFIKLGYPTAIFKDSDKQEEHAEQTRLAKEANIQVFEWGNNCATEDMLFKSCPENQIKNLLQVATSRKSEDAINAHIQNQSQNRFGLNECLTTFKDEMRPIIAEAAKKKSWYKDIEPAETLARTIIGPNYQFFHQDFTLVINNLVTWLKQ